MRSHFRATIFTMALILALLCNAVQADTLSGLPDVTVEADAVVSFRYGGTEYVIADGILVTGTTTRWYVIENTEYHWVDGTGVPAGCPTVTGTSSPKVGDTGDKADDFLFRLDGANHISSIDGIDFQQTVFPFLSDTFFVFERGGNDNGTVQAILANDTLGAPLPLAQNGVPFADTGVNVGGQNAFGYVLTTDVPVKGLRITASGHDALSISTPNAAALKKARNPVPANDSDVAPIVDAQGVWLTLDYTPGDGALTHTGYFSIDADDVTGRDPAHSLGLPPFPVGSETAFYAGYDDPAIPLFARTPLVAGETYYWAVDEYDGENTYPGDLWSFTVVPQKAWKPNPADGAENIIADPNVILSWSMGNVDESDNTVTFNVFYGTNQEDVSSSTTPNGSTDIAEYSAGPLEGETVYYWRVDTSLQERKPPFATTVIKGDVWSFTTMRIIEITDPNLLGWWTFDEGAGTIALDWSGHSLHGQFAGDPQWTTGYIDGALDFDGADDSDKRAAVLDAFWAAMTPMKCTSREPERSRISCLEPEVCLTI